MIEDIEALEAGVNDYIDHYNNERIKLGLRGLSPVDYRLASSAYRRNRNRPTSGGQFKYGAIQQWSRERSSAHPLVHLLGLGAPMH